MVVKPLKEAIVGSAKVSQRFLDTVDTYLFNG